MWSDFLGFFLLSPYKTIAFHNTTKGGRLSGRIVIIILLMYNQIVYDNKQPNTMLWSSSQMWSWLRPYSIGFIQCKCAQKVGFIPSTVGFITRALISRQHSQTNRRALYTLFLTSKSRCMQKISYVDALLTTQSVLSWSGRFGGGHSGWSQLQLASSVSPLCSMSWRRHPTKNFWRGVRPGFSQPYLWLRILRTKITPLPTENRSKLCPLK